MFSKQAVTGLALVAGAQALASNYTTGFKDFTITPSAGGLAVCVSGLVPVKASTTKNIKLNFKSPTNQSDTTQTFLGMFESGSKLLTQVMGPMNTVSGTYDIMSELCYPLKGGPNVTTVQFLTHGVGFDRSYWDFAPGYSYVDAAAAAGYATFLYDRLGVGQSERPDPVQIVQAPLEIGIAHSLIQELRKGSFGGLKFKNVVGTGHSFGSIVTTGVASEYPKDLDAAVLTGFSLNMTALPVFLGGGTYQIAADQDPYRFAGVSPGYTIASNAISTQLQFFKSPGFDPQILALADSTKQTVTYGELFTMSSAATVAKSFTGPVDVVDGANDLPFCFGDCAYPKNLATEVRPMLFPKSKKGSTYLAPVAGHGVNLHYSALKAYAQIQKFISSSGF